MYLFPGIKKQKFVILIFFVFCFTDLFSQTLIINEVSNGPSGNKEYIELVVADTTAFYSCGNTTPPCIDIRGWIIDDNSGYHGSGGIATGANRFSQDLLWSCVPLGTIILVYNDADVNADIPAMDIALNDGNCRIIAPISNTSLFETNTTTPGALACSYPLTGWIPGGDWASTLLANSGDCARIVDLNGCEVFSLCWAAPSSNTLIYFNSGMSGSDNVWFFNDGDPNQQSNWSEGCADISTCGTNEQSPGLPNNLLNQNFIAQFNNNCLPITPINVTATSTDAGCICDGTAVANASGSIPNYTYEWYDHTFTNLMGTGFTISGLCAGTYHVIATSLIDCSDTASVIISGTGSVPVANAFSNSPYCENDTIFLFSDFVSGVTYNWSGPNGFSSTNQNPEILNASLLNEGVYTLTLLDGNCSSTPVDVAIDIFTLPNISISSNSPVCEGDTLFLNATVTGFTSFEWSGPIGFSSVLQNEIIVNSNSSNAGTYFFIAENNGCFDSSQISVQIVNSTSVAINSVSPICINDLPFTLNANLPNGTWSGNGITDSITGIFDPAIAGVGLSQIIYSISGNCGSADTIQILVNSLPVISAGNDEILPCIPNSISLNGVVAGTSSSIQWTTVNGNIVSGANGLNPIVNSTGTYFLNYTDSNGCTNTDSMMVLSSGTISASFQLSPSNGILPLTVSTINNSIGSNLSYLWTTCNGETSSSIEPIFVFDSVENCLIQLVVVDEFGCVDTTYQTVQIFEPHFIYIPNVFSPNGDSSNDIFQISGEGIQNFYLEIYNRWGQQLFTSTSIHNSWNGQFENTLVPEGTYYYVIHVTYTDSQEELFKGHLTLLRN